MQVIEQIQRHTPELTAIRRDIHAHPEIGFQENRTAALVADCLRRWGVDRVETGIGRTGVVGVIEGRTGGPAIGLRADMDALPMQEETGLAYASVHPGVFHGCGHDGHTAMLLGAARYLAATRDFAGRVHVIFQPAEEGLGGAAAMMDDGLFDRFPCEEIYALHNWPNAPLGWVGTRPGVAMASSGNFDIAVTGRGAHGAMPHQAIDPVIVAITLAQALQTVVSRSVTPLQPAILSITELHAGSAYNVIPDGAVLRGTIRAFDADVRALMVRRMEEITAGIAMSFGAYATVTVERGYPALVNSAAHVAAMARVAAGVVGAKNVDTEATPVSGSEDFAFMLERVPGAYFLLGQSEGPNVHNPGYRFNDDVIPIGASILARIAEARLSHKQVDDAIS